MVVAVPFATSSDCPFFSDPTEVHFDLRRRPDTTATLLTYSLQHADISLARDPCRLRAARANPGRLVP